ncbi:MAG: hypothetical protein H0V05_10115 [Euzebyaceae bacterium]|jgi:hypothetical protein|nr:hypothetical protein [Euzebyaceae bacterium]
MTYAWIQDVPIGEDVYRTITERLGDEPLEGCLLHLALRTGDGTLRYVDVWESEALCDRAFDGRVHAAVHPVLEEAGVRPAAEPPREVVEVVDVRGAWAAGAVGVALAATLESSP